MQYNAAVRLRRFIHRHFIVNGMRMYYNRFWGTKIGEGTRISLSVKIDKANPAGITIGEYSSVAFDAAILSHDFVNNVHLNTRIGSYCFIGARSIIMPGVTVGDHAIVGTGAVVLRDVPPRSVVLGNPARVMEQGIDTGRWGVRIKSEAPPSPPTHQNS